MVERISTNFDCYNFTEQELHDASVLAPIQRMLFQTEAANCANELLKLAIDPDSPNSTMKFMLEREFIRGKIEQLQWILEVSEATKSNLEKRLEDEAIFAQAQATKDSE